MLEWIREHKVGLIIFVSVFCGLCLRGYQNACELVSLRTAYAQSLEQIKTLEAETTRLKTELERKREEIVELQEANDRAIREVTAGAYRKARNLSDDELLDAYNRLISGARKRNADRERRDNGVEE